MSHPEVEPIEFTLNGRLYVLARAVVEGRLEGVEPHAIREHAVLVNGEWFPARQALAVALGVADHLVKSRTARAKLSALGFETRRVTDPTGDASAAAGTPESEATSGTDSDQAPPTPSEAAPDSSSPNGASAQEPRTRGRSAAPGQPAQPARRTPDPGRPEADVQAFVVAALGAAGWAIRSVANTATKEHGIDVIVWLGLPVRVLRPDGGRRGGPEACGCMMDTVRAHTKPRRPSHERSSGRTD